MARSWAMQVGCWPSSHSQLKIIKKLQKNNIFFVKSISIILIDFTKKMGFFGIFFQISEHTVGRRRRSSADVDLLTGHSTITPIISSMSNVTLLCVDV